MVHSFIFLLSSFLPLIQKEFEVIGCWKFNSPLLQRRKIPPIYLFFFFFCLLLHHLYPLKLFAFLCNEVFPKEFLQLFQGILLSCCLDHRCSSQSNGKPEPYFNIVRPLQNVIFVPPLRTFDIHVLPIWMNILELPSHYVKCINVFYLQFL